MCAAPGSKTAQLIEFLHADEDTTPKGIILSYFIVISISVTATVLTESISLGFM